MTPGIGEPVRCRRRLCPAQEAGPHELVECLSGRGAGDTEVTCDIGGPRLAEGVEELHLCSVGEHGAGPFSNGLAILETGADDLQRLLLLREVCDEVVLRLADEAEHGQDERRCLSGVELAFHDVECPLVLGLVLRNGARERENGRLGEGLAEVEGQEIASRPSVAVVERMNVLEEEMAEKCTVRLGDVLGPREGEPLREHLLDSGLGRDALVDRLAARARDDDLPAAEERLSEAVALVEGVADDGVVGAADVLERSWRLGIVNESEVELGKLGEGGACSLPAAPLRPLVSRWASSSASSIWRLVLWTPSISLL